MLASAVAAGVVILGIIVRPSLAVSCADPPEGAPVVQPLASQVLSLGLGVAILCIPIAGLALAARALHQPGWRGALIGALLLTLGWTWLEWDMFYSTDSCGNPFWAHKTVLAVWPYALVLASASAWAFRLTDGQPAQPKS